MINECAPTFHDLMTVLKERYPNENLSTIEKAFTFAEHAHRDNKRNSGDAYITHPTATAILLAQMQLAFPVIVAGLLHDVLEDTPTTFEDLKKEFGEDVATMVSRVTKLGTVKYRGAERYVENLRRMFMAMAVDVRVVFIRFADRIHNLRTLDSAPEQKRRRIALESLELYAPIANRLGMGEIRGMLEDLSFKYVYPKEYAWVTELVTNRLEERQKYIDRIQTIVLEDFKKAHIPIVQIKGRTKHVYSLFRKLQNHNRDISQIYDLVALRIQVPTVGDCYAALGMLHGRWKPLKGRIKDYIGQPKPNGYQSLHTTLFCEEGQIVEIQIRTPEMHKAAEYGVAAHWQYTEAGKKAKPAGTKELTWMKEFEEAQRDVQDHAKFLENLETQKIDIFQNRIFVFTPQGDVIDLPERATPVDFAYAIHSDVGNTCTAANVNGERQKLDTTLKSGDIVEITTDKSRKAPNQDWLKSVKTSNAKNKIKAFAKSSVSDWIKKVVSKPLRGKKKKQSTTEK